MKMVTSIKTIQFMQDEAEKSRRHLEAVKAELAAAYSSSQKHMLTNELQKKELAALQLQLDDAAATNNKLNQTLNEHLAANQQKLVSYELQKKELAALQLQLDDAAATNNKLNQTLNEHLAANQQKLVSYELQKKELAALQLQLDDAAATNNKLNQTLNEHLAANQQKLVSLAAHSELQGSRISGMEQELAQALDQVAALTADCARLSEANESFSKWKQETEAWSVEAIAIIESKDRLIQGESFFSALCRMFLALAFGASLFFLRLKVMPLVTSRATEHRVQA
jgi:chromosome segregation ATPase